MTSSQVRINNYDVEIAQGYQVEELEENWLKLQQNQDVPFFLTWSWIASWLKTYTPKLVVVTASIEMDIVAIGLFTMSVESRHGFIKSRQYRLHQMGDPLLDQIWMEYNDFICSNEHRESAVNACLLALQQSSEDWDEIILSMMSSSRAEEIQSVIKECQVVLRNPSYASNLQELDSGQGYLESLNANTRYQIRRSIRIYEKLHGKVDALCAKTTKEALDFFNLAGGFHRERWLDSGYKNPEFIQFHENLIRQSFNNKSIELIKVISGDTTIAVLYFHIVNKKVFFYLHGLRYENDNKLKPGLVAHTLATQYFLGRGMKQYDYMGGYSQYKCQLASQAEDLVSLCIQRPQFSFSIEKIGRNMRNFSLQSSKGQRIGK